MSGIYDTIKDFLSEYNALLKEMNSYYNADSAKGYDVLSDDEKEAMKDSEVEKWEDKIKDSLLRRDSTLNSIISSFRNKMMGTFTASNGRTYSLSSIGFQHQVTMQKAVFFISEVMKMMQSMQMKRMFLSSYWKKILMQ